MSQLSSNQCGFVSRCGTVDARYVVRLLLEKRQEETETGAFYLPGL